MKILGTVQIPEAAKIAAGATEAVAFSTGERVLVFVPHGDRMFQELTLDTDGLLYREVIPDTPLRGWLLEPMRRCSPQEFADLLDDIKSHGENLKGYRRRTMEIFGDNTPEGIPGLISIVFQAIRRRGNPPGG